MKHSVSSLKGSAEFLGRRGTAMVVICVALALLLAVVEYALAFALIALLYSLHLVGAASLPSWLAPAASRATADAVWLALLLIVLCRAGITVANHAARAVLAESAQARMHMALAYRVLLAHDARAVPISEMSLYTGDVFPKATEYLLGFAQTVVALVQAAVIGIGALVLAPWPAVTALGGAAVAGIGVRKLNRITNRLGHGAQSARADLERTKVRIGRNRFLIRVLGIEETEYATWLRSAFSYFRNNVLAHVIGHLSGALVPAYGLALLVGIVLANARVFHTPTANLVAFFYLFYRTQQLLTSGATHLGALAWFEPQAARAKQLVLSLSGAERLRAMRPESEFRVRRRRLELPVPGDTTTLARGGAPGPRPPAITIRDVSFSWPDTDRWVIRDLSMDLPSGAQLALVGPNGSGKSTLLALLLGVLRPANGKIAIDGGDCRAWMRAHPRSIAYVGPEPYLIHASVRDNITYGASGRCEESEIWDALDAVGLADLFRTLPSGLDQLIEENGDGLSSGQKQRIAIARGLLRHPRLFVMDEPSANLDSESEGLVLEALRSLKGRCTVVLVTHRQAMLRHADQVIELGQVLVEATP